MWPRWTLCLRMRECFWERTHEIWMQPCVTDLAEARRAGRELSYLHRLIVVGVVLVIGVDVPIALGSRWDRGRMRWWWEIETQNKGRLRNKCECPHCQNNWCPPQTLDEGWTRPSVGVNRSSPIPRKTSAASVQQLHLFTRVNRQFKQINMQSW